MSSTRCVATVATFDDVARLVQLLRGRRYEILGLDTSRALDGSWSVQLTVSADRASTELLCRRLDRLAGVMSVWST